MTDNIIPIGCPPASPPRPDAAVELAKIMWATLIQREVLEQVPNVDPSEIVPNIGKALLSMTWTAYLTRFNSDEAARAIVDDLARLAAAQGV